MMKDLIINLAPTGIVPTKEQNSSLPISPVEIANQVIECASAGASIVHLHARDENGIASSDPKIFEKIIELIRKKNEDIIITVTTSGRKTNEFSERSASLNISGDLKPDMASLTLGSMNFSNEASMNSPSVIMRLAEEMLRLGIKPELEVFDLGMINFSKILISKGLLQPPYYFNILLGNPSTAQATLLHLGMMVNDLPENSIWAVAGIGRFQAKANALGVVLADGVRVGLEDNLWLDHDRTKIATNLQMVDQIVSQSTSLGRNIATPKNVRSRLGLEI